MIIDVTKSPYYIKADGKTDNAAGLMKLQKDMAASKTKPIAMFPSGIVLSYFTRWTHGVNSFKVIGNNTILKSLYKPVPGEKADEAQQRGLFAGEMMQTNVVQYFGKKEYVTADTIQTARAGDKFITLKNGGNYKVGDRVFIRSGDLFAGGYPRACRNFDWIEIEDINVPKLYLKMPLTEDYFDYDGAEIFSLDETNYCDHAEFDGITFEGNFAYPANKLILTNCNVTGWLWISECEQVITNDVYAEKIEADKLVKKWTANNLRTPSSPSNGGSIYEIELNDCVTGSIRLCPRYLETNNCKIWANKVLISENPDKYDPFIPCVADAPARNPIRRRVMNRDSFLSGPESQADKNLEFAPFEEITI